ncbi:MAG: class F sortase [Nocardioidaceae bacterium]
MNGASVRLDPGSLPDARVRARMKMVDDTGERFVVPSVGLNVPLGALTMVGSTITPPGVTSAYWVRNLGVAPAAAANGSVYVTMHSIHGAGEGPGDYLIDVSTGTAAVKPGARVQVAGKHYRVTGSTTIARSDLSSVHWVWRNVPGRLVVITCLQRPDAELAVKNVIIVAKLAGRSS